MATKAYFMIRLTEEFSHEGYRKVMEDLQALHEVKTIESVRGSSCDLLVQVEAPVRVKITAHKIRAMKWLERLNVLTVEPADVYKQQRQSLEVLKKLKMTWAPRCQPITQVVGLVMGKECNTSATETLVNYPYLGANLPGS